MVDLSQFKVWTAEEFEATFPPPRPDGAGDGASAGSQGTIASAGGVDDVDESALPDDLLEWIRDGVPDGERSDVFFDAVRGLIRLGYSLEGAYKLFDRYPGGIAKKYTEGKDRLRREIERVYVKLKKGKRVKRGAPANSGPPPEPESAFAPSAPAAPAAAASAPVSTAAPTASATPVSVAILSSPLPQLLIDTQAVFKDWLGEKYDTDLLDASGAARLKAWHRIPYNEAEQ
jgi:hypothetical protein